MQFLKERDVFSKIEIIYEAFLNDKKEYLFNYYKKRKELSLIFLPLRNICFLYL